jgi:MBG domain-containing protein/chitobiase/beta-hexosaminidase-like protein/pre-peptidase
MKSLGSHFTVIGCILWSLCSHASAQFTLDPGSTQTGTISLPSQKNTYTFTASAGDVFDFTVTATSGSLSPEIQLYNSAGALIASAANYLCSGSTLELNTVKIPASGPYTVDISDCSDTNTGNYALYSQRINNPFPPVAELTFGQTLSGTIGSAAESNTYTFSANAGDQLDFTLTASSGSLSPKIRIYPESTGALTASVANYLCSGSTIELNTVMIPVTGTYTVLVGDCSDTNTGTYDIYVQRTDNPGQPFVPILPGQTQTGAISLPAQSNTYTFSANAGDVLDFTMVTTSGSLSPEIQLYNPDGTLNSSVANYLCSGSTIEMNPVTLKQKGTYILLVGDCSETITGKYAIYSQRINNPGGIIVPLPPGQTVAGAIASAAQSNTYTFSANAGDQVDFTLTATSGSLSPKIRIYVESTGLLASSAANYLCSGSTIELNTVKIPVTGTYTVLVGDCSDTNTGNYDIYSQRTNNPTPAVPIDWGQVQSGKISLPAQNNTYTFAGTANDVVDFTIVATSGNLSPKIRLYNSVGNPVSSAANYLCSGTTIEMNSVTLPTSGTYTVLVGDCSDTNTGNYNLTSQCFGTCPVTPTCTWATPAAIVYPTPLSATQLDASCSVPGKTVSGTYVYSPAAGTVLAAGLHTLSVTFTPTDTTDYTVAKDSVPLMVNKATPVCTWATPAAILYPTPLSATQLDASCSVPGTFAYSPPSGSVLAVGTHTLSMAFTPTDTTDYTNVTLTVQLTVTNVPTVLTWPTPAPITYGTPLSGTQLDAVATVGGKPVSGTYLYVPPSGTVLPAGTHTLSVTFTPTDSNFTKATAMVTLTVNKAVLTVTANNASRVYGSANPAFACTITGFVNGDLSSVVSGKCAASTTATASSPVGTYPITAAIGTLSAVNYSFRFVNGMLTITKATPVCTWTTPAAIVYPTPLSATQLDASCPVPGAYVYTPPLGTVLAVGAHTLSVTFTPTDTTDYTNVTLTVQLTVNYPIAATPIFMPAGGTYTSVETVTITGSTSGATIYYTTNGTTPTTSSTKYSGPITLSASETIEAIAVATDYANSAVAKATYEIVGSPSCLSAPAASISTPDTTLNAVVDTLGLTGSYIFQYGTSSTALTTETAKTALSASSAPAKASAELTDLTAKTKYYFQVVVTTTGGICSGSVLSFTTN